MPNSSEYEAVRLLAQALSARDHGEHKRAIELLDRVITICGDSDTGTCQYLNRTAHVILHGIYKSQGQSDEAAVCHRKAIKLGVKKEELEL
jgi:hypothetical protein